MTDQAPDSGSSTDHPSGDPSAGTPSPWSRGSDDGRAGRTSPDPQPWSPPPAAGYGRPLAEPTPPYGQPGPGSNPVQGYGTAEPPPHSPVPGYGVTPYPGGYGGSYPDYGMAAPDHPQATAALITGIIALAISPVLGLGGLVGIASILLATKARRDIDSDPARYSGRGKATAGLVLGIVSVVALVCWVLLILLLVIANSSY